MNYFIREDTMYESTYKNEITMEKLETALCNSKNRKAIWLLLISTLTNIMAYL